MNVRKLVAAVLALAVAVAVPVVFAQDSTYQLDVFQEKGTGRIVSQAGGGAAYNQRFRTSIANVNTGVTLLPARPGLKYRVIDLTMISVGGATATCTTVDVLGTQATSSVKLLAVAVAALTQSAVVRAGAANATVLADGASFVGNDLNTAVTIGKTGGSCATATHIDLLLTYAIDVS